MPRLRGALCAPLPFAFAAAAVPAFAHEAPDIVVTAARPADTPASRAGIDAQTIATTVNAVNVEDALKYLPSLVVRKRHIGDQQAPLATRTSGLGASARSLIYADGVLLSALIGNNNTNASPRWSLVSPQEIARIDVLYGPFAAAYPGNSIGAVVNITTRLPERLTASIDAGTSLQRFDQYGTHRTLPAYTLGGTIGDRIGPVALFASIDHVASRSQPLIYATAATPAAASAAGTATTGGYAALNRTAQPIRVLGAAGFEHQLQDQFKLKAAIDLGAAARLAYTVGLFRNDTSATAETYLADAATGRPAYAGSLNIAGQLYGVAASAFSGNVYRLEQRHWSHSASLSGDGKRFDWQLIGTLFDYARDVQRSPTTALPAATDGGAGTITRLDGTGWRTLDAKATWLPVDAHRIGFGAHGDWFRLKSDRFATGDWLRGGDGAATLRSRGRTRTAALWAEDAWTVVPHLTLTVGGRYEWWRAYDGANYSAAPPIDVAQPRLAAARVSPKASLAWDAGGGWRLRGAFGRAWRFPTVAELYQVVTTPIPAVPNPNLKPERASSAELAIERADSHGTLRLALFHESIRDALISQAGPLAGTTLLATYVQNVERTRARGVELAVERRDVVPRVDLAGSVTYADAITTRNSVLPASVGKLLPSVPHWKATLVTTWRPTDRLALTAAGRYASRNYGTLDNSDVVGNTYQGFYKYLVVDLRARLAVTPHWALAVGVDNVNDDRYFLFHPFPGRTAHVDVSFRL